ncbi:MAG: hypothetical protein JO126_02955 [Alphaproteobacteria bacterium]|nr:hypothetical protein [Alphaproteobacteria bacterium]MBV8548400.1 hypothetical protein [Alphaproteobacteria bacterium]
MSAAQGQSFAGPEVGVRTAQASLLRRPVLAMPGPDEAAARQRKIRDADELLLRKHF